MSVYSVLLLLKMLFKYVGEICHLSQVICDPGTILHLNNALREVTL